MAESLPSVSVIVPVYNAERALPRLVESLRRQDYPRDRIEILMVDNNSADRSAEVMRRYPEVIALSQTRRQGPAATRNVALERATGDVFAFIDADCWAHPAWIGTGVRALLAGKLDRLAGKVEFVFSPHPSVYETFDAAMNFRQTDFVSQGWCVTNNLFTRRELFAEVGLFDPELLSHEDGEFGVRASRAGKTLGYEPNAVIYHRARRSLKALVTKWIRTEYGAAQVYRRHGLLELQLWYKKANYRPLAGVWRNFPAEVRANPRLRLTVDAIANILRYSGNLGNFLGYFNIGRR